MTSSALLSVVLLLGYCHPATSSYLWEYTPSSFRVSPWRILMIPRNPLPVMAPPHYTAWGTVSAPQPAALSGTLPTLAPLTQRRTGSDNAVVISLPPLSQSAGRPVVSLDAGLGPVYDLVESVQSAQHPVLTISRPAMSRKTISTRYFTVSSPPQVRQEADGSGQGATGAQAADVTASGSSAVLALAAGANTVTDIPSALTLGPLLWPWPTQATTAWTWRPAADRTTTALPSSDVPDAPASETPFSTEATTTVPSVSSNTRGALHDPSTTSDPYYHTTTTRQYATDSGQYNALSTGFGNSEDSSSTLNIHEPHSTTTTPLMEESYFDGGTIPGGNSSKAEEGTSTTALPEYAETATLAESAGLRPDEDTPSTPAVSTPAAQTATPPGHRITTALPSSTETASTGAELFVSSNQPWERSTAAAVESSTIEASDAHSTSVQTESSETTFSASDKPALTTASAFQDRATETTRGASNVMGFPGVTTVHSEGTVPSTETTVSTNAATIDIFDTIEIEVNRRKMDSVDTTTETTTEGVSALAVGDFGTTVPAMEFQRTTTAWYSKVDGATENTNLATTERVQEAPSTTSGPYEAVVTDSENSRDYFTTTTRQYATDSSQYNALSTGFGNSEDSSTASNIYEPHSTTATPLTKEPYFDGAPDLNSNKAEEGTSTTILPAHAESDSLGLRPDEDTPSTPAASTPTAETATPSGVPFHPNTALPTSSPIRDFSYYDGMAFEDSGGSPADGYIPDYDDRSNEYDGDYFSDTNTRQRLPQESPSSSGIKGLTIESLVRENPSPQNNHRRSDIPPEEDYDDNEVSSRWLTSTAAPSALRGYGDTFEGHMLRRMVPLVVRQMRLGHLSAEDIGRLRYIFGPIWAEVEQISEALEAGRLRRATRRTGPSYPHFKRWQEHEGEKTAAARRPGSRPTRRRRPQKGQKDHKGGGRAPAKAKKGQHATASGASKGVPPRTPKHASRKGPQSKADKPQGFETRVRRSSGAEEEDEYDYEENDSDDYESGDENGGANGSADGKEEDEYEDEEADEVPSRLLDFEDENPSVMEFHYRSRHSERHPHGGLRDLGRHQDADEEKVEEEAEYEYY